MRSIPAIFPFQGQRTFFASARDVDTNETVFVGNLGLVPLMIVCSTWIDYDEVSEFGLN
jgi:hypothetical protein